MEAAIKITKFILNIIYGFLKLQPVKKKIVILSRQSDTPSADLMMLRDKIIEKHPDYQVVMLCRKIGDGLAGKIKYVFHMFRQLYHLAGSRAAVLDSYCIVVSILKNRKSLLVIQMWHSIGTMKKFGHSILDKPEGTSSRLAHAMKMHEGYDYVLAAGEGYRYHLAEGFACDPSIIKIFPLPRVERLHDKQYASDIRSRIVEKYPQTEKKINILYCPTFRKGADENDAFEKAADDLAAACDYDTYNLIFKLHPLSDINITNENAIFDKSFSSFEMLFMADIVISDYSCIIYEAALLDLPIYFYDFDYDHYMATRDIYMDYRSEIPGPVFSNAHDMFKTIADDNYDMDRLKNFSHKYVTSNSAHETADIVDFIFSNFK